MSEQEQTYTLEQIGKAWDSVCATGQAVTWLRLQAQLLPRFYAMPNDGPGHIWAVRDHRAEDTRTLECYGRKMAESLAALLNEAHEAGTLGW